MSKLSLWAAAAIVLAANAFALLHAARNRAGAFDAELVLSSPREVQINSSSLTDDDSGVSLDLHWTDAGTAPWNDPIQMPPTWLDRARLQALGFDTSMDPGNAKAQRFYDRQRPRRVFAALENDGPGFQALSEAWERQAEQNRAKGIASQSYNYRAQGSRLVAVDADADPEKLRARHPDRTRVAIVPAVVALDLIGYAPPPPRLRGRLQEIPASLNVPLPLSARIRGDSRRDYSVRVRWGSLYEPWVESIEGNR